MGEKNKKKTISLRRGYRKGGEGCHGRKGEGREEKWGKREDSGVVGTGKKKTSRWKEGRGLGKKRGTMEKNVTKAKTEGIGRKEEKECLHSWASAHRGKWG